MSTKFNSAQNGENEVFASDTEVKTAATENSAAPADDGGDSELNIQDLLKKYLPDYAEEDAAPTETDGLALEKEAESAIDLTAGLALETEENPQAAAEPEGILWLPAQEEVQKAAAVREEIAPMEDIAEEDAVPQQKRGGFFSRLRRHTEEQAAAVAPDSEIFEKVAEEESADAYGEAPALAEDMAPFVGEEMPTPVFPEMTEEQLQMREPLYAAAETVQEVPQSEAAEQSAASENGFADDGQVTPEEAPAGVRPTAVFGEGGDAPADMDDKDISLWIALGMEEQLEEKIGGGEADRVAEDLDNEQKAYAEKQRRALEYEFTERAQIPQIAQAYKFALRSLKIKLLAAAFLTVILFFYENITLFLGRQFSGPLDPAVYPVVHIMISLQLLLIVCAIAYEQVFAGFTNLFTMRPTPESVLSVLSVFAVVYSVILAASARQGGDIVLFNFPVAFTALLSLLFSYFNTKREAFSFNIVSSKRPKFVFNRIPASENTAESKIFGATDADSPDVLRITRANFVDGYFSRTSAIMHGSRVYVGAMLSLVAAAAVLMAVFALISGRAEVHGAITIAYLTLIGVVPVTMFFTYSYPFYKANRHAYEYDSTIIGEPSLEEYAGASIVSFDDKNVFPSYSVKVQNIKIYNNNRIDRVLYYAASAFSAAGGPLSDVFSLATMEMERSESVSILSAGAGYLETKVDERQILFGRSDVLTELGYDIPVEVVEEDSYVQGDLSILYMLRDGDLIAKMYIRYVMDADFEFILRQFTRDGMCVCVKTLDPNIYEEMIFSKVRGKQYPLKIVRNTEGNEAVDRIDSGIVTRGSTKSLLQVLSYCDMVLSVKSTNTVISIVSSVVSMAILIVVMMSRNVGALHSWMLVANQLFWMIPAWLTSKLFIK